MITVVLDTNVYISAILFGGRAEDVRKLSREGVIEVFVSEAILAETGDVLRKKFDWQSWQISLVIDEIREFATLVFPGLVISKILEDDSDNRILECAVEGNVQHIVSGDKHLLKLKEYQGIKILTPAAILDTLKKQ